MERLGFLQLAKRFLQLGKDAAATADDADDRYIQPPTTITRPTPGRTLSLKIFNRVQQQPPADISRERSDAVFDDQLSRSAARKKFHSVKEGANSRVGRKENADPCLRIASMGRKHVFAGRVATKLLSKIFSQVRNGNDMMLYFVIISFP